MESLAMANSMTNIRSFPSGQVKVDRIKAASEIKSKIYLVGAMRAVAPGGEDILPRSRKTRALLACLCLAQGERVSRSRLAGLLWDRSGDAQARMSLRHALSELNTIVNGRVPGLIEIDRDLVRLDARACWIDAFAVPDHSERLLEDFDGLSSAFDHWLTIERVQFEDRLRATLENELNRLTEENAAAELRAAAARRLINFEPTHEGAVRSLITAFVEMGDRAQAVREYERCRIALHSMLDLTPSKETVALYEALRLMSLSRIPTFFVISRLSTLTFRNQDRLPQEVGEVLGVRYVLSGSMRVTGDRLRLTVELTDTRSGTALWSSGLDEKFFDLLEVQNRLAESIVRRVAPYLYSAELRRVRKKRPEHLESHDLFLRAQENMNNPSRAVFETSEHMFDEAIRLDPHYAPAVAWRAYWHVLRVAQGWSPDCAHDTKQADHFAERAVVCDALEPMALAIHGHVAAYLHKDFDLAFRRFETALRVNPNAAPAWLWSAAAHAWIGNGPQAVEEINRAISLS